MTQSKFAFMRTQVRDYQMAQGNKQEFELLAKHHGSKIYKITYNQLQGIICDNMAMHNGRTIITLENLQYFPAKIHFYYTRRYKGDATITD